MPDHEEWRSAMIDAPFFPVATPLAFYELQNVLASSDHAEATKRFAAAHPRFAAFGAWAKSAPQTGSFAEDRFNSLNSFVFIDAAGTSRTVRWSFVPVATPRPVGADELRSRDPDFLASELAARLEAAPVRWKMVVTVAETSDPTADPSEEWPKDRRTVDVGVLTATKIEPEVDGACRDVNFDPTVLPSGMAVSDDPFPAARSAAYAVSFDRRTAELQNYLEAKGQRR